MMEPLPLEIPNTHQWDSEIIQTESEVTLVKFDSQLEVQGGQPTLNHLLQKYTIEQRLNFVIDRDKGQIVDVNSGEIMQKFKAESCLQKRGSPSCNNSEHGLPDQKNYNKLKKTFETPPRDQKQSRQVKQSVWDDYWQQSDKIHKKFLMSICQKNNKLFSEIFNKKLNHLPININIKSFDNWTPIHFASMHGYVFALEHLLNLPQIFVNSLTNFKMSALHVSTKNNKIDSVNLLIKAGIEINFQDQDGNTALHYAAELGYKDIVTALLNVPEILVNLRNHKGLTAKEMTTSHDVIKIFSNSEKPNNSGDGLLSQIKSNKHVEKLLMKVNQNFQRAKIQQQEQKKIQKNSPSKRQSQTSQTSSNKKAEGKRQNIVRMYQLLKQKKNNERVGLELFKFYKNIGAGAFGEVFIVKKGRSDKLYALKAIKKSKIIGSSILRYIQTQKQVLSLIKHPFIVKLHYAFQTQAYLFLVMDYCEGGDLGKLLQKNRHFDQKTVKGYAAQILLALEALHKEKIIYRDLKPDNIVLDGEGHALLTDFGLSKKTVSIDDINKSFCGTPAYLPLQIINKKGHNRMADWYEYGVVLYQLYTGIPPFYADTRAQLYQNVRTGIIKFPRGTPENFRDLIKKLLSQNPQKRLGFVQDAESIKIHPWFSEINWQDVENRKLEMPPITNKVTIGQPIPTKFLEVRSEKNLVNDWSFIAS